MDPYNHRSNRQSSRLSIDNALDRLGNLATIDPTIVDHLEGLADYHESDAADAYPLFHLDDIAHLVPSIVADNPKLAGVLEYVAEADSDAVACIMAAIRERIIEMTRGTA